jgi:hypothetical protein
VRVPAAKADGVSVRRGTGDLTDADSASRTVHIFNNDRLAERAAHAFGQNAPDRIHRPARSECNVQFDRMRWINLCCCACRASGNGKSGRKKSCSHDDRLHNSAATSKLKKRHSHHAADTQIKKS